MAKARSLSDDTMAAPDPGTVRTSKGTLADPSSCWRLLPDGMVLDPAPAPYGITSDRSKRRAVTVKYDVVCGMRWVQRGQHGSLGKVSVHR